MKCKKCNLDKSEDSFYKNDSRCKKCLSEKSDRYYKTKNGVVSRILLAQKANSKARGHVPPAYSKEQLSKWLFSQQLFFDLYDAWVASDYDRLLKPSCDRLVESEPYTFKNIELKTYGENLEESYKIARSGDRSGRPVIQLDLNGNFINEFKSIAQAQRKTGAKNIYYVCSGVRSKSGGFRWKYAQ